MRAPIFSGQSYWGEGRCRRCEGYGCYHHVINRTALYLLLYGRQEWGIEWGMQ